MKMLQEKPVYQKIQEAWIIEPRVRKQVNSRMTNVDLRSQMRNL
jgi:hypothetical protein